MPRIRGMAFLGAARHIKRNFGDQMLATIVQDAGPAAQKTFSKRIDGLGLHPYPAFSGMLRSLDRHLGTGDLEYCKKLGDLSARIDLETIFKVYKVRPAPEEMIRGCMPIWSMYTDGCGHMEAVDTSPDHTVVRIYDFPQMDSSHCRLMEGWMLAALDVSGVEVLPGARESECMRQGGRYHEFSCQWRQRDR